MSLLPSKTSSGIFIKQADMYVEFTEHAGSNSIISISKHLGYDSYQIYTYHGKYSHDPDIHNVVFEIFTLNVLFVLTEPSITTLRTKKVESYLKDCSIGNVYDRLTTTNILDKGLHFLTIEYLAKVLDISHPEKDGMFFIESLSLYLYFIDGILVDYQSSDGLSDWAKYFQEKAPELFNAYESVAKRFWGNNIAKIVNEINMQFNALAGIPNGAKNEFIELHETPFNTFNFVMLQVCHYEKQITFSDFIDINKGRLEEVDHGEGIKTYTVDRFSYIFNEDGSLDRFAQLW